MRAGEQCVQIPSSKFQAEIVPSGELRKYFQSQSVRSDTEMDQNEENSGRIKELSRSSADGYAEISSRPLRRVNCFASLHQDSEGRGPGEEEAIAIDGREMSVDGSWNPTVHIRVPVCPLRPRQSKRSEKEFVNENVYALSRPPSSCPRRLEN